MNFLTIEDSWGNGRLSNIAIKQYGGEENDPTHSSGSKAPPPYQGGGWVGVFLHKEI